MEYNHTTHKLNSIIVKEDGSIEEEWIQRDQPLTIDATQYHTNQWYAVRRQRDDLLATTDWVVTKAYEQNQPVPTEWAEYRQALRDITQQRNPFKIVWPTKPIIVDDTIQYITVDEEIL